jgi:hypothetical protein
MRFFLGLSGRRVTRVLGLEVENSGIRYLMFENLGYVRRYIQTEMPLYLKININYFA